MFIVLEGVDASGKSTIGRLFSRKSGFELYSTPPKKFIEKRTIIDAEASAYEHFRFYSEALRIASDEIWELLSSGKNVICDRYWLSTIVYHRVMGLKVQKTDIGEIVDPDLTILLLVGEDVQAKRLLERGMSEGDRRMINHQLEIAREYKRIVSEGRFPAEIINTDHFEPQEIVDRIMTSIL